MEQTTPYFGSVLPGTDVYRVATPKTWFDLNAGRLLPVAFRMKKADLDAGNGLSVIVAYDCPSPEATGRKNVRAVGALNVGAVRNLQMGIDIIQDDERHAGIHGLPFTDDETDLEILQLMDDYSEVLAEISTICSHI